jgi:hypothetical protein
MPSIVIKTPPTVEKFQTKIGSDGYPPDLEMLVKGRGCDRQEDAFFEENSGGPDDRKDRRWMGRSSRRGEV